MKDDPILSVIQQIKSKQIDSKHLSAEDRQRCVEFLRVEGYQISEIAQILGRHERTIQRDIIQIRNANAVARDPRMLERVVGDVLQQADSSRAVLRRIARESGASAMERLMAEQSVWKIVRECVETLQSVGYLPKVPTGVVAEIHQHIEYEPIAGYDELQNRLMRLKSVGDASGNEATIDRLIDEVQRGRLTMQVDHAATDIQDDTQ